AEYSAIADPYARLWSPVIRPMALPILEMLPLGQARDILDVGAGTGELFKDLSSRAPHARIMGVDRSEGMLRVAQARGGALLAEAGFTGIRAQGRRVEHRFTVESLLTVQVRCGLASRRLPSLATEKQARCRAQVEERLRRLSAEELVYRPEVIFATALRA